MLEHGQISTTNVRPAYEASLAHGVCEQELRQACGLTRALVNDEDAVVDAQQTYRHMEFMHSRVADYGAFVLAATRRHTLSSLGIVGLACKTVDTLGQAMLCHQRFQHLTNRTAEYQTSVLGGRLCVSETRHGPASLGSMLVSDYATLIAVHLVRESAAARVDLRAAKSRRATIQPPERAHYESFLGVSLDCGAAQAGVCFDAAALSVPVATADPEMSRYFRSVLERTAARPQQEPTLVGQARTHVRAALPRGDASMPGIAKAMGMGARTLQRRLAEHGTSFADVVDSTRRALADAHLTDPRLSVAEIAYLLGYREQASFFRAFRRWHGTTPAAYRRHAGEKPGGPP